MSVAWHMSGPVVPGLPAGQALRGTVLKPAVYVL
jgi:hypothetical protein